MTGTIPPSTTPLPPNYRWPPPSTGFIDLCQKYYMTSPVHLERVFISLCNHITFIVIRLMNSQLTWMALQQ